MSKGELTDFELFELTRKASELRKGPQGLPGVGIKDIVQVNEQIRFELSDGGTRMVTMPAGIKGERGLEGLPGKDGVDGITGLRGPAGPVGPIGPAGRAGRGVEACAITEKGKLLFEYTDGEVVSVGNIKGPQGLTGAQGAPGTKGADGADGAGWLSGPRPPAEGDGNVGDHWLDYASPKLVLYKKLPSGWSRIATMRPEQTGGGGSATYDGGLNPGWPLPPDSGQEEPDGGWPVPPGNDPANFQDTQTLPLHNAGGTGNPLPSAMAGPIQHTMNPGEFPPMEWDGTIVENNNKIFDAPGGFENQAQWNNWVYVCLQRLAGQMELRWPRVDGGDGLGQDDQGAAITMNLDGDDALISNSHTNVIDGGSRP